MASGAGWCVVTATASCRQGTGARGLIEKGLNDVGVPVLNLEVDCVDERNFSVGQLSTRLQAFVELLQAPPELVLERSLADPPLSVQQEAVVVQRLQDPVEQLLTAEKELVVEDG